MKRFSLLLAAIACACAGPREASLPNSTPPVEAVVEVIDPNFEVIVLETVPNVDDEGVSFTKVLVDGEEVGKTSVGPRSQEKRVRLKLPAGNKAVRMEHWILPAIGEWNRMPESLQPRERFVRIEDGTIAQLTLRYGADGTPSLNLTRNPAPAR